MAHQLTEYKQIANGYSDQWPPRPFLSLCSLLLSLPVLMMLSQGRQVHGCVLVLLPHPLQAAQMPGSVVSLQPRPGLIKLANPLAMVGIDSQSGDDTCVRSAGPRVGGAWLGQLGDEKRLKKGPNAWATAACWDVRGRHCLASSTRLPGLRRLA